MNQSLLSVNVISMGLLEIGLLETSMQRLNFKLLTRFGGACAAGFVVC